MSTHIPEETQIKFLYLDSRVTPSSTRRMSIVGALDLPLRDLGQAGILPWILRRWKLQVPLARAKHSKNSMGLVSRWLILMFLRNQYLLRQVTPPIFDHALFMFRCCQGWIEARKMLLVGERVGGQNHHQKSRRSIGLERIEIPANGTEVAS